MNIPKLRFPEFSGEWEEKKLADIALFSKGKGYTKNDLQKNGTPIILYGRMYTKYETIIDNVDTFVNMQNGSVISKGGEIIVPASGETAEEISRASVVKNKGIILGGDLNIISIPTDKFSSSFLALNISNGDSQRKLSKLAQGKSVVHLHNEDLSNLEIKIPSLPEQQKIADFLSTVDSIIASETKILNALQKKKKALMQKLFSQQLRFKADDGSEFPEWEERKLGEVCEYIGGGTPSKKNKDYWNGTINWASVKDITSKYLYETQDKITQLGIESSATNICEPNTLILITRMSPGKTVISKCMTAINQDLKIVKSDIEVEFLHLLFQSIQTKIDEKTSGTTVKGISIDSLNKIDVQIPCKEEQQKIADCLSSLDLLIQNQQKVVTNWQHRKKALLQQMFV